jgi:hypothetical protein
MLSLASTVTTRSEPLNPSNIKPLPVGGHTLQSDGMV